MPNEKMKTAFQETVLVIVAHSDDETLGAGGTIARHVENGDSVFAISMTDGVSARAKSEKSKIQSRHIAAQNAAKILGFKWLESGSFPDNAMDNVALLTVVQFVEIAKKQVNPSIVYTHSPADLNVDHRIVFQAVLTAFRPEPDETLKELRAFEVPSATDYGQSNTPASFNPNLFVQITDTWDRKRAALNAYGDEMRPSPHSRSLEGLETLARYRGHQTGIHMAEAFQIFRKVER